MKVTANNAPTGKSESPVGKHPYKRPEVREYGKVHLLTQGTGPVNGDGGQGMMYDTGGGSDRRIKEAIVRIGNHPLGIGLYLFDYLPAFRDQWGHGRQFGVMADEVETVMPEAVSTHANGYKIVDYTLLGISRTRH
jgi:Chaperone of endosialidase